MTTNLFVFFIFFFLSTSEEIPLGPEPHFSNLNLELLKVQVQVHLSEKFVWKGSEHIQVSGDRFRIFRIKISIENEKNGLEPLNWGNGVTVGVMGWLVEGLTMTGLRVRGFHRMRGWLVKLSVWRWLVWGFGFHWLPFGGFGDDWFEGFITTGSCDDEPMTGLRVSLESLNPIKEDKTRWRRDNYTLSRKTTSTVQLKHGSFPRTWEDTDYGVLSFTWSTSTKVQILTPEDHSVPLNLIYKYKLQMMTPEEH